MYGPNVQKILDSLSPNDLLLDVGGWACPFNRANYVLDIGPYETRGYYGIVGGLKSQGGDREYFTKDSWIQRDFCDRKPFPFADKQFDFVICSHTLEDIRDPLWVCSEMMRVAKRGYIEVPSRIAETCRGWEHPKEVGLSHHRWLITIDGNFIDFLMKYHMIHTHWRFSFPVTYFRALPLEKHVQWMFWEDSFSCKERIIIERDELISELETFVDGIRPYPRWRLAADKQIRKARALTDRVIDKARRMMTSNGHAPA